MPVPVLQVPAGDIFFSLFFCLNIFWGQSKKNGGGRGLKYILGNLKKWVGGNLFLGRVVIYLLYSF